MMDCKGDLAWWCLPNLLPLSVGFLQLGVFSRLCYFRDREPLGIPQMPLQNWRVAWMLLRLGAARFFGGNTPRYTDVPWFGAQPWGKAASSISGWVFDILAGHCCPRASGQSRVAWSSRPSPHLRRDHPGAAPWSY